MERVVSAFGFKDETRRGSVGVKIGLVAERQADLYLDLSPSTKQGDTCGPEAILVAAVDSVSVRIGLTPRLKSVRLNQFQRIPRITRRCARDGDGECRLHA